MSLLAGLKQKQDLYSKERVKKPIRATMVMPLLCLTTDRKVIA